MAKNNIQILLGFEDEIVTDKNKHLANFKTNKIGGKPDIPSNIKWEVPKCSMCQLPKPLVVQIYAPLDNSRYHRTLYIFACINPNCWNHNESWTCFRVQSQETSPEETTLVSKTNTMNWCNDAEDWGDDNNANENEENGNIITSERISDEDDESYSFDDSVRSVFENLTVDDRNANVGAQGGAVGRQISPGASAEIEGDEGEIITIDSPVMPQRDIRALLLNESVSLPLDLCSGDSNLGRCASLCFTPYFMSVWEESDSHKLNDVHVKELLQDYQQNEDINFMNIETDDGRGGEGHENYEKSVPAHGDKMFHYFLSRVQRNPGQILRYSREIEGPLLLHPQKEPLLKCPYCQEDRIFEFQILSTIIPKLRLVADQMPSNHLDFGTVLIYTCRNSCWSSDNEVKQETVIVQKESY